LYPTIRSLSDDKNVFRIEPALIAGFLFSGTDPCQKSITRICTATEIGQEYVPVADDD
jgi:hypothetical protein